MSRSCRVTSGAVCDSGEIGAARNQCIECALTLPGSICGMTGSGSRRNWSARHDCTYGKQDSTQKNSSFFAHPDHPIENRHARLHVLQIQALHDRIESTAKVLNRIAMMNIKLDIIPSIARNRVCPSS